MDFHNFASLYANKTADELLRLVAECNQLTPEARSALLSEISRRRLVFDKAELRKPVQSGNVSPERAKQAFAPLLSPSREFIGEVLRLYHHHVWLFLKLTAPAVLIGTVAILATHYQARNMIHHIPRSSLDPKIVFIEASFVNLSGWAISWVAVSFAFACIAAIARQITRAEDLSAGNACGVVRKKFSSFFRISMSLFLVFGALFSFVQMLTVSVIFRFLDPVLRYPILSFALSLCAYTAIALIVSRFALTIPAVVLDDFEIGQSFFRSDELTEGKWMILAILLSKAILGGYVAAMAPFWVVGWLPIPENIEGSWWFYWFLRAASVAAVLYVEPIMFIGFALLYETTSGQKVSERVQTVALSSN
jgi:hypothetical protein